MSYNYKKLLPETPDKTHAAKFLQKVGIIHRERYCPPSLFFSQRPNNGQNIFFFLSFPIFLYLPLESNQERIKFYSLH